MVFKFLKCALVLCIIIYVNKKAVPVISFTMSEQYLITSVSFPVRLKSKRCLCSAVGGRFPLKTCSGDFRRSVEFCCSGPLSVAAFNIFKGKPRLPVMEGSGTRLLLPGR